LEDKCTNVVTPGSAGVPPELLRLGPNTSEIRIVGVGDGVPSTRRSEAIEVLLRGGPVATFRVVDTPWEHVIGSRARRLGRDRGHGIRGPVDDGDDAVRREG
jgi:hypothetical protein